MTIDLFLLLLKILYENFIFDGKEGKGGEFSPGQQFQLHLPIFGKQREKWRPCRAQDGREMLWSSVFMCLENVPNLCDRGPEQPGPTLKLNLTFLQPWLEQKVWPDVLQRWGTEVSWASRSHYSNKAWTVNGFCWFYWDKSLLLWWNEIVQ